jgi:peptidoglycan/xylan/chitin deacetylase (PgdA/CDA1 family)
LLAVRLVTSEGRRRIVVRYAIRAVELAFGFLLLSCRSDECKNGTKRSCYDGPPGTEQHGTCKKGQQVCRQGKWDECAGEVLPEPEQCDGRDHDCNGLVDDAVRNACGGCQALSGAPGDVCGCGHLYCASKEKLSCAAPAHAPGSACMVTPDCVGTYHCDSDGVVRCVEADGGACAADAGAACIAGASCVALNGCAGVQTCEGDARCVPGSEPNECGVCGGPKVAGVGTDCSFDGGIGHNICDDDGTALLCAKTVVTLTFDDTFADTLQAPPLLEAHGMRGVFYVNSPRFRQGAGYMTLADVLGLQKKGHEIGGHTLDHPHLPTLSPDEQHVEICNDRANLLAQGLVVRSFAYPFGEATDESAHAAKDCNYDSARAVGILAPSTHSESYAPDDPFFMHAPGSVNDSTDLVAMQREVTEAESRGGWLFVNMHHVCDGCSPNSVPLSVLSPFLDWLEPRKANGTFVRLTRQMIRGDAKPAVHWPEQQSYENPNNLVKNPSFEVDADGDGAPDCWQHGGTDPTSFPWTSRIGRGSPTASQITVTDASQGTRTIASTRDGGTCAPSATAGRGYWFSAWYTSATAQPSFTAYYRDGAGTWHVHATSRAFSVSSSPTKFAQATWRVDPLPEGAQAIGIEFGIGDPGTMVVDDMLIAEASLPGGNE